MCSKTFLRDSWSWSSFFFFPTIALTLPGYRGRRSSPCPKMPYRTLFLSLPAWVSQRSCCLEDLCQDQILTQNSSARISVRHTEYDRAKVPPYNGNDPPPAPGSLKALLFPPLLHNVENKGKRGVRARYGAELPPFISTVRCPGRPVILGMDLLYEMRPRMEISRRTRSGQKLLPLQFRGLSLPHQGKPGLLSRDSLLPPRTRWKIVRRWGRGRIRILNLRYKRRGVSQP